MLDHMSGLRRVTLNRNPLIADRGATFLAEVLEADLWIKGKSSRLHPSLTWFLSLSLSFVCRGDRWLYPLFETCQNSVRSHFSSRKTQCLSEREIYQKRSFAKISVHHLLIGRIGSSSFFKRQSTKNQRTSSSLSRHVRRRRRTGWASLEEDGVAHFKSTTVMAICSFDE